MVSGASAIDASSWGASPQLTITNSTVELHVSGSTTISSSGGTFTGSDFNNNVGSAIITAPGGTFTNSTFRNNTASVSVMFSTYCGSVIIGPDVNIDGCTFERNAATTLTNRGGTSNITRSTVSETLGDCLVISNPSGTGDESSTLNVSESTFSGNSYGVVLNHCGTGNARSYANIVNSSFSDNSSDNRSDPCVIGNTASTGSCQSHMQLSNVTVSGGSDTAVCNKSGLMNAKGYLTVRNSLLIGHPAACTNSGIFITDGGTVHDGDSSCAFGESDLATTDEADTILSSSLADNGGPTQTLSLPAGSPAIDFGGACVDHNGDAIVTDQRGEARDATCDAGAYEVQGL